MFKVISIAGVLLSISWSAIAEKKVEWPSSASECAGLTARQVREDAKAGSWRYYRDPQKPSQCILISYQSPWDQSKPVNVQIVPSNIPEKVRPYLTQHALLETSLPSRGSMHVSWIHLGYAEDRLQHRRYLAILSQPQLAGRVNEVMAWQALVKKWPLPGELSEAEKMAHGDLTVALLLAQEDPLASVSKTLSNVHASQEKMQFYRFVDAMQQLRKKEMLEHFGKTTNTPTQDYYLPVRSEAVYQRLKERFEKEQAPSVSTLSEAALIAIKIIKER